MKNDITVGYKLSSNNHTNEQSHTDTSQTNNQYNPTSD